MSGASVTAQPKENALKTGEKILQALHLTSKDIDKLQALPLADLDKVNTQFGLFSFFPSVDGRVLPASPFDPQASDLSKDVPILVGTTKDEAAPLTVNDPNWKPTSEEQMLKGLTAALGGEDLAKKAITFYRTQDPKATPHEIAVAINTDNTFWSSSVKLAERRALQPGGAPVYMYRFDWGSPVLANTAPHAVELPLLFDNADIGVGMVGDGPTVQPMANVLGRSFVAFMRTGNPGTADMPKWPKYTVENRDTMIFDNTLSVLQDPNKERRLFWKEARP
jgi:para-nitrobenzyl esterase